MAHAMLLAPGLLRCLRHNAALQGMLPSLRCRGDLSDEFRLASFLPALLQPPVDRLAGACTRVSGLGSAAGSQQHQAAWRSALVGGGALPGSLDMADDAARRRWEAWGAAPGCVVLEQVHRAAGWSATCHRRHSPHGCDVHSPAGSGAPRPWKSGWA